MINTMKAAVLAGKNDLRIQTVPVPRPGPKELLVQVEACGVCGSDMPRVLLGTAHHFPIILGHEFCGRIVEVGSEAKGFTPGERVSCAPLLPCMQPECPACAQGRYAQCTQYSFIGSRVNGAWAEYVTIPASNAVKLSDGLDAVTGALLEPVTVALHGIYGMGYTGGPALVVGLGAIGMLTAQCLLAMGCLVYGTDVRPEALDMAQAMGVVTDLPPNIPWVLETAGAGPAFASCLQHVAPGGHVMLIGTPTAPVTFDVKTWEIINRKELTVQGSWMSYSAPFPGREWTEGARLMQEGLVDKRMVAQEITLETLPEAFARMEKGPLGKVVIRM